MKVGSFKNIEINFSNSLIIHEENTKENHKRIVSWYRGKELP